ncbi:hypothetical protein D3C85_1006290 [compost metagenome]
MAFMSVLELVRRYITHARHVDHEAVLHVVALQTVEVRVGALHSNDFAAGQCPMFGAEIQQFLDRPDATDERAGQGVEQLHTCT